MYTIQLDIVDRIMAEQPIISNMVDEHQVRIMLQAMTDVLTNDIPGDIVELGCNKGTNALFLQRMLLASQTEKKLHLYDSFEGLPEDMEWDRPQNFEEDHRFGKGSMTVSEEQLRQNFSDAGIMLPNVHKGWFKDIPDSEYPEKVAFAFFDGDLYSSIHDSFVKIYPRLATGAYVFVHDYQWERLPGVEKACRDFLMGKVEYGTMVNRNGLGCMRKL
jgi:O-methyltransferase